MNKQSSYRYFITRVVLFSFLFQQGFTTALWAGKYDEISQTRQVVTHKLHHVRPQDPSQSNTSGDLVLDLEKRTLSVVLNDVRERWIAPELRPQLPWEISREGMTHYLAAYHWTATELECGNFKLTSLLPLLGGGNEGSTGGGGGSGGGNGFSGGRDNFYGGGGGTSNWSTGGGGSSGSHKDGWNCDKNGKNCHLTITVHPGGTETSFSKGGAGGSGSGSTGGGHTTQHTAAKCDVCQKIVSKASLSAQKVQLSASLQQQEASLTKEQNTPAYVMTAADQQIMKNGLAFMNANPHNIQMNPVLQLQAKIQTAEKNKATRIQQHQATIASLKPQINSLTAQLTQIEQQEKAHQLALQKAEEERKVQEEKLAALKAAEEKKALALQQDQARQEELNKDYLHIQTLTEKLLTKLNAQAVLEQLKFPMTDVVKQEMPVKNLVPLLAIIDDCCATAKQGGLTAEKDRSYTQLMGQLILTNVCTWNDWALASLEADPDRAKGIAAGLYAGNYLLPMLLGTIESWINPEGQAPLTVGLLSAFHKEMQTVGHGLTAAINALDLDAEEKAAYGAIASIAMAGVMKWVKSPQGQLGQVVNGLSETNVAVKSAVITSRFKAAFSKNTTEFLTDLETRSGSGLVKAQRERLLKYATEVKIGKMEETAYRAHEKQYKALSDAMKREWEKNTGQKWPQYGKWNELKQKIVPTDVDLHHIIPQRYGGPHEWWNAHPVHPGNHTGKGGIHADPNSLLKQTLKE